MRAAPLLALLLAAVAATRAPSRAAEPESREEPAATATLVVDVEGLKDDRGTLHAALYASEDGFPTKPEKALRQVDAPIAGGRARATFEGLAASNDAKGFMGPPSFEKARVEVKAGENRIAVRLSY